jgi:hypothetical protein
MSSPLHIGARRTALGALAIAAFVIAVGTGITYGAGGPAWLVAALTATFACLGVLRLGNPRWIYMGRQRHGRRSISRLDSRLAAAIAGLGTLSLLHLALSNGWQVTWWAIIFGGLAGYTISPPSRPTHLD